MLGEIEVTHSTWGSGLSAINSDTIINTAMACGVLLLLAIVVRIRLNANRPNKLQSALEMIIEYINGIAKSTFGNKPIRLGGYVITLFLFVLVSNWWGLIPTRKSPTNDINTAAAIGLLSIFLLHFYSVRFRGPIGYIKHYFSVVEPKNKILGFLPRAMFALIETIVEISKPLTLTLRLYLNIFVGELLLALILLLPIVVAPLTGALGVVWVLFSLFVGAVQAFIFMMLTIAYISMGTDVAHAEAH